MSFLKLTDVNSPDTDIYSISNENVRSIKVLHLHIPNLFIDWTNAAKNPSDESDESYEENVCVCVCMSNALLQS